MKIGVIVESFCEELHTALRSAAAMGIQGVQIYACHRSHDSLIDMSSAQRAELLKFIRDLGMEVSSICGDLGGHGFQDKAGNPKRIELSKKIIDACCEFDIFSNSAPNARRIFSNNSIQRTSVIKCSVHV